MGGDNIKRTEWNQINNGFGTSAIKKDLENTVVTSHQ